MGYYLFLSYISILFYCGIFYNEEKKLSVFFVSELSVYRNNSGLPLEIWLQKVSW